MKAKQVIRDVVPWASSRTYFYWRMRRRLLETRLSKDVQKADDRLGWKEARGLVESWMGKAAQDDQLYTAWVEKNSAQLANKLAALQQGRAVSDITSMFAGLDKATKAKVMAALGK